MNVFQFDNLKVIQTIGYSLLTLTLNRVKFSSSRQLNYRQVILNLWGLVLQFAISGLLILSLVQQKFPMSWDVVFTFNV